MLTHVDDTKFTHKPSGAEIGGIKYRFTKPESIQKMTVEQIAKCLESGQTVQPGVTPFSERSRAEGKRGTCDADFQRQELFMLDIDNKRADVPKETPAHVVQLLSGYNLHVAFAYPTFNSTPGRERFRIALACDEEITDKEERDGIQKALISLFPQSDPECTNADRIFFGTDKGLYKGIGDIHAVCSKADLLALAADVGAETQGKATAVTVCGGIIPVGRRNSTLSSFAAAMLKKYGNEDGKALEAFQARADQCEQPLDESELQAIWRSAMRNYETVTSKQPDYIPPAEYAAKDFAAQLIPGDFTDVGQANALVELHGSNMRYSKATAWLVYTGGVWREDDTRAHALAQDLTEQQLELARRMVSQAQAAENEAVESADDTDVERARAELKFAKNFRSYVLSRRKSNRIAATLTEARPKLQIDVGELDSDPFLLNTPGGIVDLRTGALNPHDPQAYCTKCTAATPGTEGAEEWRKFLQRLTCGDRELELYVQTVAGMFAVGKVLQEKLIIAHGEGGNGKSTFFNLLSYVLGDYADSIASDVLTTNTTRNKAPEYAELRGKRLVIAAELEEGARLDTATVKRLCSTDPVRAEKKYKDPFTFTPSHTVVLFTNHLPKVGTTDKGTWDRLVVVPFNARFRGEKGEIFNYAAHLFEHCGGAVLSWIIEGAGRFIKNGFQLDMPQCVKDAIASYRDNNDWLEHFLCEECDLDRSYRQKSGELYQCYRAFCERTGDYRRSLADFKAALTAAGYETRKTKVGAFVYGLRVRDDFLDESSPDIPQTLAG